MASTLSVDVGIVILVGLCVALPASLCGWLYAIWIDRKLNIPIREAPGLSLDDLSKIATRPEDELPAFWVSMSPILLPVVFIAGNTVANTFYKDTDIARLTGELGMSLMLLGYLLAMLVKIAQGSGTVAMITASAIMAPLLGVADLAYHPVYVLMSSGSGALIGTWMNDSGFWVFRTMTGLTEIETLQTKTALLIVLGGTGFTITLLGSWLFPLI